MTAWNPTRTGGSIALTNSNLTATAEYYSSSVTQADTGFAANAAVDVTFSVTLASGIGSPRIGLGTVALALNDLPSTNSGSDHIVLSDIGGVYDSSFQPLATLSAPVAGDVVEVRMKAGRVYFRINAGPWNGDQAHDPAANNGIPLTDIGSAVVYPTFALQTGGGDGGFASWAGATVHAFGTPTGVASGSAVTPTPTASSSGYSFTAQVLVTGSPTLAAPLMAGGGFIQRITSGTPVLATPELAAFQPLAEPFGITAGTPLLGSGTLSYYLEAFGVTSQPPAFGAGALVQSGSVPEWEIPSAEFGWSLAGAVASYDWFGGGIRANAAKPRATTTQYVFTVTLDVMPTPMVQVGLRNDAASAGEVGGGGVSLGMRQDGSVVGTDFTAFGSVGLPVQGDTIAVRMLANTAYFSRNGGAEVAVPLGNLASDVRPAVFSTGRPVTVSGDFTAWRDAPAVQTTQSVAAGRPVWGAPLVNTKVGFVATPMVVSAPELGASNPSAYMGPLAAWVLTDEAGGPITDETGAYIEDETAPATSGALGVVTSAPALGAPLAGVGAAPGAFTGVGVVVGSPALGLPTVGVPGVLTGVGVVAGSPAWGTPPLSVFATLASALGVTAGTPTLATPAMGAAMQVFGAVGVETLSPTWGTPAAGLMPSVFGTPTGVTTGAAVVPVASGLSQVHTPGAIAVVAGGAVVPVSPALVQRHAFAPVALSTGLPVLVRPALSANHALAGLGVTAGVPALATRALGQVSNLAGLGVTTSTPALATPVAATRSIHDAFAQPNGVSSGAPVPGAPTARQRHAVAGLGVTGAVAELGSPPLGLVSNLGGSVVVGPSPDLGTPALTMLHAVKGVGVVGVNRVWGRPAVAQTHAADPVGIVTSAPLVRVAAMRQEHAANANGIETGAPEMDTPAAQVIVINFAVVAVPVATDAPDLFRPILTSRNMFVGVGITTGAARIGTARLRWTGIHGGNDDDPPPVFTGHGHGVSFLGEWLWGHFTGKFRSGNMK